MDNWPQYTVLALLVAQLLNHLIKDQKEPANTSARAISVIASFGVFGIWIGLLWAGGFWESILKVMH